MILTVQQAIAARDFSMALVEKNATAKDPRWPEDANAALLMFCTAHPGREFLTEDVRQFCEELDLADMPHTAKAWGPVMRQAAKDGLIRKVGYAQARSSNMAPKCLWQSCG